MLDYVRFPSDGDVGSAVYPGRTSGRGRADRDFVAYASTARAARRAVSTALFGLSATRDMRIGQVPTWISARVDQIHPMAYPALYGAGELGIASPSAEPGETVFRTLVDFQRQLKGSERAAGPWIQDWATTGSRYCADRRGAAAGRQGLPALERRRACTRNRRASLRPRSAAQGASRDPRDQVSPARS